jgi:hypothetical protein
MPAKYGTRGLCVNSPITHVHPHARNSKDTDTLPNGKKAVKKCFWLNREYVAGQVK